MAMRVCIMGIVVFSNTLGKPPQREVALSSVWIRDAQLIPKGHNMEKGWFVKVVAEFSGVKGGQRGAVDLLFALHEE